ncbi:GIP [Symbiodinium sp. CCMP2592]|nr:GIP [Symbiodinium sp. CCMP2592]
MSSGVEVPGDVPPGARGDDEPAASEQEVSVGSERHESTGEEWGYDYSGDVTWWEPRAGWDWSWNRSYRGDEQGRRSSWTTSWDAYSTEASTRHEGSWGRGHRYEDGWYEHGDDDRDHRSDHDDYEGVWRDPWADGRAGGSAWHDPPQEDRYGSFVGSPGKGDPVWSGWKHFTHGDGGFQSGSGDSGGQKGGNPRPSEKLSVPTFGGGDDDDVGTSARSYLRQVEAWRRLTYLPPNQQGLVLYRHLTGKAWVAAEELNVDALSRGDGVHYLMSWLRNRYLDLEVTRIGKALSEMFRKLRRRPGQSIRDYNAEYDRLHARLKEVGCMLPEECAAWLYVDRLQLEDGAELNLLASVGNVYSLNKLQKAAIIQDRGLRKPWESTAKGGRKPYTAHVTDHPDDADEDSGREMVDGDGEECMPEEVAVAYVTYQTAKNKYREHSKARGFKGEIGNNDGGSGGGKGGDGAGSAAKVRDEKLKQIKARSFCSGCGRRGHWHKDDECPNNAGAKDHQGTRQNASVKEVCVTMPAEVMTVKHVSGLLLGITDTACSRTVAGTQWLQEYMDRIGEDGAQPELSKECEAYKFGTGRIHYSSFSVLLSFSLGDKIVQLRASIIPGDVPLLLSKTVLGKMGMIYDVSVGCADFTHVGLRNYKLLATASGHPAIPIVPAKPAHGFNSVLPVEDVSLEPRVQYTVHAVAFSGVKPQNFYNLYYEKKLPPEVKNMLNQTHLCRDDFMTWWKQCEVGGVQKLFAAVPRGGLRQSLIHGLSLTRDPKLSEPLVAPSMDSSPCNPPVAISKMTKPQLLAECIRLGLTVHKSWSSEEIKAVIMEHRERMKDGDATEKMKRLAHLTMEELKLKARELDVAFPEKITKGNLLRLVRDSLNTPDNELMKIGKFRGMEFREIPWQYGQWASNEVKTSKTADPDLVRYARWWENKEANNKGYVATIDQASHRAIPTATSSEAGSWDTVTSHCWETSWNPARTATSDQGRQMPLPPGTSSTTNTKRRPPSTTKEVMEDEIDEETAEEIKKLELRLEFAGKFPREGCCGVAVVFEDVLVDGDLTKALSDQHDVFKTTANPAGAREDLPLGEQLAQQAYERADFRFATLQRILENSDLKPRRNDRGIPFHDSDPEVKMHNYFTFGLFTHGGVQGITKLTVERPHLARYLNSFGVTKMNNGETWTSVTVGKNVEAGVHRDYNNLQGTANYTCSFGQSAGGDLWLEDKDIDEGSVQHGNFIWKRSRGGAWLPGRTRSTKEKFLAFNPHHHHCTCPWEGDRWSVTYHTTRGVIKASKVCCKVLNNVGYPLPKLRGVRSSPSTRRPKKSIRNMLANTVGRLSVMMTTLLCAASSFMCERLPDVQVDPIVMFEIGGIDATYEAVELGKAVIEPMTWEDYGIPRRREDAVHFVKAASPKELRINLQEMPDDFKKEILALAKEQLGEGGSVVFRGGDPSFALKEFAGSLLWNYQDQHGERWAGFGVQRPGEQQVGDPRHPHQVFVVEEEASSSVKAKEQRHDGSAITFEAGVSPIIQSSLRRLHQNLGHPRREDLVRHLRLAGCEDAVLKAAKGMKCEVCASCSGPRIARPSAVPRMYDFNDCVGADLLHHHDIDDVRHTFLSIVDWGTSYHIVIPLSGLDNEDIEKAFNDQWVVPFGPPKTVSLDLDGAVQKGICRLCEWHNIAVKNVAAQAHWQAGITERQGAWWKNIWDRVRHELSITKDEVHLAASIVSSAKNELRRRCGHTPTEWVFGRHPRLPAGLVDPDGGEKVTWDVTPESQYQRATAIRTAARLAFHHAQGDSRLRKALLQRARTTTRPIEVGESVHFWDQPKNRRRGRWAGPAVVVGREGENYWISKNGRCRLTAAEHLRPSGPEEVGEYLRVKGAQAEVEKLLEMDFDADETYDAEKLDAMELGSDDQMVADDHLSDYSPSDVELPDPAPPGPPPLRRLKRKTRPGDIVDDDKDVNETYFSKKELTQRGVEKRQEKELRWDEIPRDARPQFKEAEETQWKEHLDFDALEPLSVADSDRVREQVDASRLVIAGHTDPDLANGLSTDAPTLSRPGLMCLLQLLANGLGESDPWRASAGDIRCAFLTGGYLRREEELFLHQPSTGFAGLHPRQLVRIKKNIFGLATSPHEWWGDLQSGIKGATVTIEGADHIFDQCGLDPCIFILRRVVDGKMSGPPVAYVGTHVDDLLVVAPRSVGDAVKSELSKVFPVDSWEDDEFAYLGSEIICREDSVLFRQKPYIDSRLFTIDLPKNVHEDDLADNDCLADNRSLIGALSWVSAQSRPDLTCSVSMAQQLQKCPTYGDVKFTNGISKKATEHSEEGLVFYKVDNKEAVFLIYHDAAWADAYEGDYDEEGFELYEDDKLNGLQREGPPSHRNGRKAKRGNSRVASQLGELVMIADMQAITGGSGRGSILDWKSRAGQRVCRSTFSAETQACVEGLEGGQYVRAIYETLSTGSLVKIEDAVMPLVCLSDCRSLYDHLHREGVPRTPADRRLAIDLAALRQALREERWTEHLPLAWIPSGLQLGDILTKPQDPKVWWSMVRQALTIPISIVEKTGLASKVFRDGRKTSVKRCVNVGIPSPYTFDNSAKS